MKFRMFLAAFLIVNTLLSRDSRVFPESEPYRETVRRRGPAFMLSLREAVTRALRTNLELDLERSDLTRKNKIRKIFL